MNGLAIDFDVQPDPIVLTDGAESVAGPYNQDRPNPAMEHPPAERPHGPVFRGHICSEKGS
jgi:hypothetical protein